MIFTNYTGCQIFPFFFPNWRAMRTLMKTIKFGKNLRLSQIQPIKTAEIKSIQFRKKKGKTLHPVYFFKTYYFIYSYIKIRYFEIWLPNKYFCSKYVKKANFLANCTQNTFLKTGLFKILIPNLDQKVFLRK
jgi:hypothetical protein